jgi:hypothetical protein
MENQNIITPQKNDVLSGRGVVRNNHHGNIQFRSLVRKLKKRHELAPKYEKPFIAKCIIDEISKMDPPGRFLKETEHKGCWVEISEKEAMRKTRAALREKDKKSASPAKERQAEMETDADENGQNPSKPIVVVIPQISLPESPQEKRERPMATIGSSNNIHDNQLQRQMPIAERSNNAFDKPPLHGAGAVPTHLSMSRIDEQIVFSTSATSLNGMFSVTASNASNNTSTDDSDDSMNLSRQDKTNEYMSTIAGMSSEYMLSSDSSKGCSGPDSTSSVLKGSMFGSKDSASSGSKFSSSGISGGSSSLSGGSAGGGSGGSAGGSGGSTAGSGGSTAGSGSGSSSGSTGTNEMPSFPL